MGHQRIAVVLGAGGITSIAWLLGALEAIAEATGWDPREADTVCGTSAGAIAAAVLVAGTPTEHLLQLAEDPDLLDLEIERATGGRRQRHRLPLAWPGSLGLGATALLSREGRGRLAALSGWAPGGFRSGDEIRGLVRRSCGPRPTGGARLLVNAVDYDSGRRVTFGAPGAPTASQADAVCASAAVPGYYRHVSIDGRRYVDGGVASFTNADVVAAERPDLVLCLSPFGTAASPGARDRALWGTARRLVRQQTARELDGLRAQGAEVVLVEAAAADLAVMGLNPMERRHSRAVVEQARRSVAGRPELRALAAALQTETSSGGRLAAAA